MSSAKPRWENKRTSKASAADIAHFMIWNEKLLFPSHERIRPLLARPPRLGIGQGVTKGEIRADHIRARCGSSKLFEPTPVAHVVVLCRLIPRAGEETIARTDDLS